MDNLALVLAEVGIELSDVFGADAVLWVEGDTEKICFRMIIEKVAKRSLLGISIAPVRATGDFERKRPSATTIWEIYERLTGAGALMPPAIRFLFDRESRTMTERADLSRRSKGHVIFLPRRCFENYLIHPPAIAAVLHELLLGGSTSINADIVRKWIESHGSQEKYGASSSSPVLGSPWLEEVDGSRLLSDLFSDLTSAKAEYRKTRDSVKLTEWLISNDRTTLEELDRWLLQALEPNPS